MNGKAEGERKTTLLAGKDFELKAEVTVKFSVPMEAVGPAPMAADLEAAKTSVAAHEYLAFVDASLNRDRAGLDEGASVRLAVFVQEVPLECKNDEADDNDFLAVLILQIA